MPKSQLLFFKNFAQRKGVVFVQFADTGECGRVALEISQTEKLRQNVIRED